MAVNRASLHFVLAKERNALQLITTFSTSLTRDMQALKSLDNTLGSGSTPAGVPAAIPSKSSASAIQQANLKP